MSKTTKYTLIFLGANVVAIGLLWALASSSNSNDYGDAIVLMLVMPALLLVVQLILGIIFTAATDSKELGQGMLVAVGIVFLIGLSMCGIMGM